MALRRLLLHFGESVGAHGRMVVTVGPPAHAAEDEEVKEVHAAEYDQHHADLYRERFDGLCGSGHDIAELEGHADVAEVDQVKPDDKQVIDGIGECLVAVEDVDQKHAAVFVESPGHPDGQSDTDRQVNHVGAYSDCHGQPP